jgi:hypothetical protein
MRRSRGRKLLERAVASIERADEDLRAAIPHLPPDEATRLAVANRETAEQLLAVLDAVIRHRAPNVRSLDAHRALRDPPQ